MPTKIRKSEYISVDHTPLSEVPAIHLEFISGGGWQNRHSYRIRGGPDDGKRIELLYWMPEEHLKYGSTVYNGSQEEYDNTLGVNARPGIHSVSSESLHITTVMYIFGLLIQRQEYDQAEERHRKRARAIR